MNYENITDRLPLNKTSNASHISENFEELVAKSDGFFKGWYFKANLLNLL